MNMMIKMMMMVVEIGRNSAELVMDSSIFIAILRMEALSRKGNLKWCDVTTLELVNQVYMIGAFQRVANESLEPKFKQIVENLWKLAIFQDKGQPIAWNTIQHKFATLFPYTTLFRSVPAVHWRPAGKPQSYKLD